ncbi:MAG TPA: hypothetical protein VM076_24320, partial [Gemmatimonadaceae bacterium]|nr:hypothetical protein [Gemmatimonadaceae bacterium]
MRVNVLPATPRAAGAFTSHLRRVRAVASGVLAVALVAPVLSAQSAAPRITPPKDFFGFNIGDD